MYGWRDGLGRLRATASQTVTPQPWKASRTFLASALSIALELRRARAVNRTNNNSEEEN
ncbi:hypothetical protein AB0F20_08595 [Streptomyces goshikiensis]|uniref:hypothetical protein n=1 Tax=Streptomyces goshikiensis TaxID=1942 RepID=UPI0033DC846F